MKKTINILLLALYSFGTFCLPMGNFSSLNDLPEMYHHCKAEEDADLNIIEFFAEHVSTFGQLIEGAEHEKEANGDKTHEATQLQIVAPFITLQTPTYFRLKDFFVFYENRKFLFQSENDMLPKHSSRVFRPPICA